MLEPYSYTTLVYQSTLSEREEDIQLLVQHSILKVIHLHDLYQNQ